MQPSRFAPLMQSLEARFKLRACVWVGQAPRVTGKVWIHGDGEIRIGDDVTFDAAKAPIELYSWPGAAIVIGDGGHIEGGSSIEATESIVLGARSRIGAFCKVMDNHFHPLIGNRNVRPKPRPVVIEEDVTIGPRAIVLAGARVERGSRIEGGSIVKRSVTSPPRARSSTEGALTYGEEHDLTPEYVASESLRVLRLLGTDRKAALRRVSRGIGVLRARVLFRDCECGDLVNAMGHVRVTAEGKVRIADRVQLSAGMFATELTCRSGAELTVGARTLFSYGVTVEATDRVHIGERCMFGSMVCIRDKGPRGSAPIRIGDDVWVAHGAIVEPGVTIGDGAVVGAGSVVTEDVPAFSLATGNPAVSVPLR